MKLSNDTQQKSVYAMLERYVELQNVLFKLGVVNLINVLFLAFFEHRIDALLTKLRELNDVIMKL